MQVESIGPFGRGVDQGGDLVGDLVQHPPQGLVHVRHAQQHDLAVEPTFAALNRDQSGRLTIPQLNRVQDAQIGLLN